MNHQSKPHYKILLVGKTGAGKSTAINMIVNLCSNLKYEDQRIVAITQTLAIDGPDQIEQKLILKCNLDMFMKRQSDTLQSSSKSQTRECHMYTLENDEYILTLIDTPGLGDTEGTEEDERHIQKIVIKIQQMAQINALLYIHRSSDCRKDLQVKYYINALRGMLTKDCYNNIIVCYTGVVNPLKIDAKNVISELGFPTQQFIYFENDCLTPIDFIKTVDVGTYEDYIAKSKIEWNSNRKQFQKLIKMVSAMQPKETANITDLYIRKRAMIKVACDKQHQIKHLEQRATVLEQVKNSCNKVQFEVKNFGSTEKVIDRICYSNVQKKIKKSVTKQVDKKITFCNQCQQQCHNPCSLEELYSQTGHQSIKNCVAFDGKEICKECSHSFQVHFHTLTITEEVDDYINVTEPYTSYVTITDKDAVKRKNNLQAQLVDLEKQKNQIEVQIKQNQNEIDTELKLIVLLYNQVNQIAMEQAEDVTVEYLESQIKQVKNDKSLTKEEIDRLTQKYKQNIERYLIIKKQVLDAKNNTQMVSLDDSLQQALNQRLKQAEQGIFNDQQHSAKEYSEIQKPTIFGNITSFVKFL